MAGITGLKIGEVSKQTGVAIGALRYYESLDLLQSKRGENGYRYYPSGAIAQVQLIKKAQSLGFSLEDIGDVFDVHRRGHLPCDLVQTRLQAKIEQLEAQIQEMQAFKIELEQHHQNWATSQPQSAPGEICPLIQSLPLHFLEPSEGDIPQH